MSRVKEPFNPFYILLTIVGITFTITACAYCVVLLQDSRRAKSVEIEEPLAKEAHPESVDGLLALIGKRGGEIMAVQLGVLGVLTVGAIGLDHWRGQKLRRQMEQKSTGSE